MSTKKKVQTTPEPPLYPAYGARCKTPGCWSCAINPHAHGRELGVDLDLCDVCYWRKRAKASQRRVAALEWAIKITGSLCWTCIKEPLSCKEFSFDCKRGNQPGWEFDEARFAAREETQ